MKGLFLLLWAGLSLFALIALWVGGQPEAAIAVLVVNVLLGKAVASTTSPPPPKLVEAQVKSEETAAPGMAASSAEMPQSPSQSGILTISHIGFQQFEKQMALILHLDGEAKGEIGSDPVGIPIGVGRHSMFIEGRFKAGKVTNGAAWSGFMNAVMKLRSASVDLNVVPGGLVEVICKREQAGLGKAKLILYVKEAPSKSQKPEFRTCPMCAEEIRVAAVVCKHCQHKIEGAPA